jgi:hypothetical protein
MERRAPIPSAQDNRTSRQSEAGDPSLHGWRPFAARALRLQAGTRKAGRQTAPPSVIGGSVTHFIPSGRRGARTSLQIRQTRAERQWNSASRCRILAKIVDEIAFVKSVKTDQFNHAPRNFFSTPGFRVPAGT